MTPLAALYRKGNPLALDPITSELRAHVPRIGDFIQTPADAPAYEGTGHRVISGDEIVRAAAKARAGGDPAPKPTGVAADIIEAGRKRRGEQP